MNNPLLPERLKNARENIGITMAEASRRLNLSKIGYCRYEHGERVPSPQTVEIIAKCFGTSVGYLTGFTDDISPDYLIIEKNNNSALYELVKACKVADENTITRLLKYLEKLTDS